MRSLGEGGMSNACPVIIWIVPVTWQSYVQELMLKVYLNMNAGRPTGGVWGRERGSRESRKA